MRCCTIPKLKSASRSGQTYLLRQRRSFVSWECHTNWTSREHLRKGEFIDLGPSAGYAYTLVVHEHWFITGSAVAGVGISAQRTAVVAPNGRTEHKSYMGPGWHGQFRAGAGYNSARYYVGLSFLTCPSPEVKKTF